jgi:hypothetical protein
MSEFVARHVRREHTITVDAPVDRVFPLLTPAGEELWVSGWKPVYLHPTTGEMTLGMVFTTGAGNDTTYWSVVHYDPVAHVARYARVTPVSRFGFVDVACTPAAAARTRVTVAYTYTALTEAGNAFIDAFTETSYRQMIEEWRTLMGVYLARTR